MSDPKNPISWVEKAEEDLEMAEIALDRPKPLSMSSTFHSQQCTEKYMKGLRRSPKPCAPLPVHSWPPDPINKSTNQPPFRKHHA